MKNVELRPIDKRKMLEVKCPKCGQIAYKEQFLCRGNPPMYPVGCEHCDKWYNVGKEYGNEQKI